MLGDDYESPSQCYAGNTQDVSAINDSIRPSGRQLNYEEPETNTEVDRNIQKLQDFIKNRNPTENDYASNEPLPHTEPPESGKSTGMYTVHGLRKHFQITFINYFRNDQ